MAETSQNQSGAFREGVLTEAEFIEVMVYLAKHDDCEVVFWHTDLRVVFGCSDFFAWACADGEYVTPADLPLIDQARADLEAVGIQYEWVYELWAARKRCDTPIGPHLTRMDPAVRALFLAVTR